MMESMVDLRCRPKVPLALRQPTLIERQDLTEYVKTVKRYAHNIASKYYTSYEELVSFGMYSLFKHLRVYDYTRGEFRPFLINVYHNMVRFAIGLNSRSVMQYSLDDVQEEVALHSTAMRTSDADNRLMVQQILSLLTESEREIIVDRFFYDRTLDQIGNDLGLSKERIRQKIDCILKKIRKRVRV
jgi:RNA polymerase sigma factor (sigma-70 family)